MQSSVKVVDGVYVSSLGDITGFELDMPKLASARWRTAKSLMAMLGKDAVSSQSHLASLGEAAIKMGRPLPGRGLQSALRSLPLAKSSLSASAGLPPKAAYRSVTSPIGLSNSGAGYHSDKLHASPWLSWAKRLDIVPQPSRGPLQPQLPRSLIGAYATRPGQRYTQNFGLEGRLRQDGVAFPLRSFTFARVRDLFDKLIGLKSPTRTYETLVRPNDLKQVLLDGRVITNTPSGREMLRTSTMPAGVPLPPSLSSSKWQ